jgi:hypothetical protein
VEQLNLATFFHRLPEGVGMGVAVGMGMAVRVAWGVVMVMGMVLGMVRDLCSTGKNINHYYKDTDHPIETNCTNFYLSTLQLFNVTTPLMWVVSYGPAILLPLLYSLQVFYTSFIKYTETKYERYR